MSSLALDPDRALPFPAEQRSIAREIYGETKDLPLICMHGHVEPDVFAEDLQFADPAQLLIVPDHYVFRMLAPRAWSPHSSGCRGSMGSSRDRFSEDLAEILRELEALPRDALALLAGTRDSSRCATRPQQRDLGDVRV